MAGGCQECLFPSLFLKHRLERIRGGLVGGVEEGPGVRSHLGGERVSRVAPPPLDNPLDAPPDALLVAVELRHVRNVIGHGTAHLGGGGVGGGG